MKTTTIITATLLFCLFSTFSTQASDTVELIKAAVNKPARSDADRKRDETSKPVEVLSFFQVKPGMKVLDLLSGDGYYSEILANVVGDKGEVVAQTNAAYGEYVKEAVQTRFGNDRLPQVTRLISEVPSLQLGEGTFDMILMVMVYHDIYYVADYWPAVDRDNYFSQIHRALKPGGVLAIIDHSALPGSGNSAAQKLHRIDEQFARKDIESAGFTFDSSSDVLRNPDDARTLVVFDDRIRRKTDRFIHRYIKK